MHITLIYIFRSYATKKYIHTDLQRFTSWIIIADYVKLVNFEVELMTNTVKKTTMAFLIGQWNPVIVVLTG